MSSPVERQPGEHGCCLFHSGAISEYVVFTSLSVFYPDGKTKKEDKRDVRTTEGTPV